MTYKDDPVFRAVREIRTPGAVEKHISSQWRRWNGKRPVSVQARPGLTNYKPFQRARVMVAVSVQPEGDGQEPGELTLFFHVHRQLETARQELENSRLQDSLPCAGPPAFMIPAWRTVAWNLPNTPNLRELADLLNQESFSRMLLPVTVLPARSRHGNDPELLRYVPRVRAILTWVDPATRRCYFAKLYKNDAEAARGAHNIKEVQGAAKRNELGFAVPRLVAFSPECRTLLMTEVPGSQFTAEMRRALPESFAQMGRHLARLHASTAKPEKIWTADQELADLRRHMEGFTLALPHLEPQLGPLLDALADGARQLPFENGAPIHGNLFGDQILYGRDGFGMVDWDAFCLGDPLHDVGRLMAHLIYLAGMEKILATRVNACIDAMLGAYREESRQRVDPDRLNWHLACQLLLRAKISSLRKLARGWPTHLESMVAEAQNVLEGRSKYLEMKHSSLQLSEGAL